MTVTDNRLDRELTELVATTTTLTESDLRRYRRTDFDDPDHEYYAGEISDVIETLEENPTTRRAIAITNDDKMCIVGVHILNREKLHVLAWLRASDSEEYRDGDIGFLYSLGRRVRKELGVNKPIMLHVFTSSLHTEVNDE